MQIHVQHGLRKSRTATLHDSHLPCLSAVVIFTSSTRTRRGGSCLKNIYKTFLIYRTCMRRVPAKPVRACTLRNWRLVSHVTFQAPLHTSHLTVFTLHTTHFTLHSSHPTLHLIWALLTLSQLSSSHLISSHMSSKLSWITSQYYYKGTCMRSAPARPVRACFVRSCCGVVVQEHDLRASPVQCNVAWLVLWVGRRQLHIDDTGTKIELMN